MFLRNTASCALFLQLGCFSAIADVGALIIIGSDQPFDIALNVQIWESTVGESMSSPLDCFLKFVSLQVSRGEL